MADGTIRVLIADDHPVVRQGLRTYLELQPGIEVAGEAGGGIEAAAQAERLAPDVVLLDMVMPQGDGLEALRRIRAGAGAPRVVVLTSFPADERVVEAMRAGAAGYLLKDAEPSELLGGDPHGARGRGAAAPGRCRPAGGRAAPAAGAGARPDRTGARGARAGRARAGEQGDRPAAVPLREDGEDARLGHPAQARRDRPHPGGAARASASAWSTSKGTRWLVSRPRAPGRQAVGGGSVRWWGCGCEPRIAASSGAPMVDPLGTLPASLRCSVRTHPGHHRGVKPTVSRRRSTLAPGGVAQGIEQQPSKLTVAGSIPAAPARRTDTKQPESPVKPEAGRK